MAILSQDDLDRRLAEAGGATLVHSGTVGKRKIPNPNYNKYDPSSQETIEVDVEQWKAPNGHIIQAARLPDGSWDVSQDEPPAPKPATTTTAQKPVGSTTQVEGTPDPSKDGGFDNERPVMVTRGPDGKVISTEPLTPAERKDWQNTREQSRNPGGQTDEQIQAQGQKDDTTVVAVTYEGTGKNRQKVTTYKSNRQVKEAAPTNATPTGVTYETRNGRQVKVTKYDDNTETTEEEDPTQAATRAANEARANRVTIDGRIYQVTPGVNGASPTLSEIKNPNDTPPPDLPAMRLEAGKISEEMKNLWEELNARVRRGEITREQAKTEFEGRYATAQARMAEIKQTVDTQQGIYRDQLTQRSQDLGETQSRRSAATAASDAAQGWLNKVAGLPGGGKADYSGAVDEIINRAYKTQGMYGATRETPAVQLGPAAQAANSLTLPGMPSPSTPMATPGAAMSEVGQPGDPASAGSGAPAQVDPARRAAMMANPAFRPQPPVNMAPGAAGVPPVRDDWRTAQAGADQGDSMGAASKILTPAASAGAGSPMMGKTMSGGADNTPPALASLLEMELPGGIKVRVPSSGGMQQSSSQPASQQQDGNEDQSDRIKRMRDLAPDDPNWQRSLDEQERRYGRPTPQSMWAA